MLLGAMVKQQYSDIFNIYFKYYVGFFFSFKKTIFTLFFNKSEKEKLFATLQKNINFCKR